MRTGLPLFDIQANRDMLDEFGEKLVDVIAFSYGDYNQTTLQAVQEPGLKAGFSTQGCAIGSDAHVFILGRTR